MDDPHRGFDYRIDVGLATSIAQFLEQAPFDAEAALMVALPDLSTWLEALIQTHLDAEPTWPGGWSMDGAAPQWMEYVDPTSVRFAGLAWLLGVVGGAAASAQQPFAGTITLTPARDRLASYRLDFGDAALGSDPTNGTDRDRRDWPNVENWLFTFAGPIDAGSG
jgi:hypothetical protein